jgi:hypothetical protein
VTDWTDNLSPQERQDWEAFLHHARTVTWSSKLTQTRRKGRRLIGQKIRLFTAGLEGK